jgi:uncharacterized protein (DUF1501 family)
MPFSRRSLLRAGAASAALLPLLHRPALAATGAQRLLVVYARGAWDITFSIDPKDPREGDVRELVDGPWLNPSLGPAEEDWLDPDEGVVNYAGIPVAVNPTQRPQVAGFFSRWADRCVVVNGVSVGSIVHDAARLRVLTGSRTTGAPDLGAIVGATAATTVGYVDFAGQGFVGPLAASSLRVGNAGQLAALLDPTVQIPLTGGGSAPRVSLSRDEQAAIDALLDARAARLRGASSLPGDQALMDALLESLVRGRELRGDGPGLAAEITLGETLSIGGQFRLALKMFQEGHCATALIDSGLAWDTHTDNHDQHRLVNSLFSGLSAIAQQLQLSGMLDDTLVVVMSEFTRTPKLNGALGKDHWPVASMLLFGGGLAGGRVLGGTDDGLAALPVDPRTGAVDPSGVTLGFAEVSAGLLSAMGVDPAAHLPGVEVFDAIGG